MHTSFLALERSMIAPLTIHPICNRIPKRTDDDRARLVASMKKHGFNPNFPIVTFERQVLDGRTRQEAAAEAGVDPVFVEWHGEYGDPLSFVLAMNYSRAMLTQTQCSLIAQEIAQAEQAQYRPEQRVNGTDQGKGQARQIAAQRTGASSRSIERLDRIKNRTIPEVMKAIDDGKLKVADAERLVNKNQEKQRQALGEVLAGKAKTIKEALQRDPDVPRDGFGVIVPPALRGAFTDQTMQSIINLISGHIKVLRNTTGEWNRWLQLKVAVEGLERAREAISNAVPYAVHPKCDGKGCDACRHLGWVPESVILDLETTESWE
jgi:hypothetical protein